MSTEEKINHLLSLIDLEEKAQSNKYAVDHSAGLKNLKKSGLLLQPIRINRKTFGYADYPVIEFTVLFNQETSNFRSGCAIEWIMPGEDSVKGMLHFINGNKGEARMYAPDFPDWIEDKGVGIKLAPDNRSFAEMRNSVGHILAKDNEDVKKLFQVIHNERKSNNALEFKHENVKGLNESQAKAVEGILNNTDALIIHGPPGTGKTTTVVKAIKKAAVLGQKVIVSAPSNAAVDHIASQLIAEKVKVVRLGNTAKIDNELWEHTPEGITANSEEQKQIKKYKKQAQELRKMAHQYKRSFGKSEREQRKLLIQEVKSLRAQVKSLESYSVEKKIEQANVICGTPVSLRDTLISEVEFDFSVIDEAGQCIEPMAWIVIEKAKKTVLVGDPYQLPPTIISDEAAKKGLNVSILERAFKADLKPLLLNTQYRMTEEIAGFSNNYFYEGKLQSASEHQDEKGGLIFYDTAGAGMEEKQGEDGGSLFNQGELDVIQNLLEQEVISKNFTLISPYSGQVNAAKSQFPDMKVSTIDSFQGQENEAIIISLVRSNTEGNIGFLKDYRRMNVALTRAKRKLIVIGDSGTLGNDKFYGEFLNYVEEVEGYKSVFEVMY